MLGMVRIGVEGEEDEILAGRRRKRRSSIVKVAKRWIPTSAVNLKERERWRLPRGRMRDLTLPERGRKKRTGCGMKS